VPPSEPPKKPDTYLQIVKAPAASSPRRGDVKDEVVKYDDAEWHSDGTDEGLDAAGTHIGLFLAWVVMRGLDAGAQFGGNPAGAAAVRQKEAADREAVRRRAMKGSQLLSRWYDDKLFSTELTAEGAAFANSYYAKHYLNDYEQTLAQGLPSQYSVPDTWESFDKMALVLDRRFAQWQAEQARR
jgi:hypothetical protein